MTRIIEKGIGAASGGVKSLVILIVYSISFTSLAMPPAAPGPLFVRQSLIWLPAYLEAMHDHLTMLKREPAKADLANKLLKTAEQVQRLSLSRVQVRRSSGLIVEEFSWIEGGPVRFAHEASGVFHLPHEAHVRDAVTGDAIDSPIIFNLDRISSPDGFTFVHALRLWVHELGHKVRAQHPEIGQLEIDQLAAEISRMHGGESEWSEPSADGLRFLISHGAPPSRAGMTTTFDLIRENLTLVLQTENQLIDITKSFVDQLDSMSSSKYFETERYITSVRWLSPTEALFEMQTYRFPKNVNSYLLSEIGGPYRKVSRLRVEGGDVQVLEYEDTFALPERAYDASAKIDAVKVNEDGSFSANLELTLRTERFFHASGYPTNKNASLLALSGGRSLRIPIRMEAILSAPWGAMPADIYKTTVIKKAVINGLWPEDAGHRLEVTGIIDRFLKLGLGYPEPDVDALKLVHLSEPVFLIHPCEALLKK